MMRRSGILAFLLFAAAATLHARVTHVEIQSRKDIWNGRYELITGRVYFALDPANAHDSVVVDLDKAPRNAQGEVELSSDLYVMRPKAGGNDALFFEVPNRGGSSMLRNDGEPRQPFLLERGYTIAWIGWQFDARGGAGHARLYAPVANGVHGDVRSDFVVIANAQFSLKGELSSIDAYRVNLTDGRR